jgi:hypothetical protein
MSNYSHLTKEQLEQRLGELNREAKETSDRWMQIACKELKEVPSMRIVELGMIVGGQMDSVEALRQIIALGQSSADTVCTAATAALMMECEARRTTGRVLT